jgi:hypothetical protein
MGLTFAEAKLMLGNPRNVRLAEAIRIATHFFGKPRRNGSHHIFKMKWPSDPRVNLQDDGSGKAKPYQVRQLSAAIEKLEGMSVKGVEK